MLQVTFIIGPPAVGKSTLVKSLLRQGVGQGEWKFHRPKWLPRHVFTPLHDPWPTLIVVGRYDDLAHKYPGTDRLSMAAQPHLEEWLATLARLMPDMRVVLEGDRFGNWSMIHHCVTAGYDVRVIELAIPGWILKERRQRERMDQSNSFWTSRQTKVANIRKKCKDYGVNYQQVDTSNTVTSHLLVNELFHGS